jgi:hypothetical protein
MKMENGNRKLAEPCVALLSCNMSAKKPDLPAAVAARGEVRLEDVRKRDGDYRP